MTGSLFEKGLLSALATLLGQLKPASASAPRDQVLLCLKPRSFKATGKSLLALNKKCPQIECIHKSSKHLRK